MGWQGIDVVGSITPVVFQQRSLRLAGKSGEEAVGMDTEGRLVTASEVTSGEFLECQTRLALYCPSEKLTVSGIRQVKECEVPFTLSRDQPAPQLLTIKSKWDLDNDLVSYGEKNYSALMSLIDEAEKQQNTKALQHLAGQLGCLKWGIYLAKNAPAHESDNEPFAPAPAADTQPSTINNMEPAAAVENISTAPVKGGSYASQLLPESLRKPDAAAIKSWMPTKLDDVPDPLQTPVMHRFNKSACFANSSVRMLAFGLDSKKTDMLKKLAADQVDDVENGGVDRAWVTRSFADLTEIINRVRQGEDIREEDVHRSQAVFFQACWNWGQNEKAGYLIREMFPKDCEHDFGITPQDPREFTRELLDIVNADCLMAPLQIKETRHIPGERDNTESVMTNERERLLKVHLDQGVKFSEHVKSWSEEMNDFHDKRWSYRLQKRG